MNISQPKLRSEKFDDDDDDDDDDYNNNDIIIIIIIMTALRTISMQVSSLISYPSPNFMLFTKCDSSFPCSQKPYTSPHPEPNKGGAPTERLTKGIQCLPLPTVHIPRQFNLRCITEGSRTAHLLYSQA